MIRSDEMDPSADTAAEKAADAIVRALPDRPIDPAFSQKALRAAREELAASQTRWQRTERLFTRVVVPAALVACAAGWAYHVAQVAERVYLSHGG